MEDSRGAVLRHGEPVVSKHISGLTDHTAAARAHEEASFLIQRLSLARRIFHEHAIAQHKRSFESQF